MEKLVQLVESSTTFLSLSVADLVIEKGIGLATRPLCGGGFLNSKESPFTNLIYPGDEASLGRRIEAAAPLFADIHAEIRQKLVAADAVKDLVWCCSWMHQADTLQLCVTLLQFTIEEALHSHECLLLLTAALERALGNVYLLIGKRKVPSLLRDLLSSEELLSILGEPLMIPLQLLMGGPKSLNIRNLAWHGFANVGEINSHRYASVLLAICVAIGQHLAGRPVVPRRWTTLPKLPAPPAWDEKTLSRNVDSARCLPDNRRTLWRRSLQHYLAGNYGRCCVLILPELEHFLRIVHCVANECPSRVMTAETSVHYTTLDVILDRDNRPVQCFLGSALYSALLDVLVEPSGPRIRDRLGHGECSLLSVDESIASHLLAIASALLALESHSESFSYSPVFSPAAIFKGQLIETLFVVEEWIAFTSVPLAAAEDCPPTGLACAWINNWSRSINQTLIDHLKECQLDRFRRGGIWRRTLDQMTLGCQSVTDALATYRSAPLRSRQRSTRARLEAHLPLFVRAVQLALFYPVTTVLDPSDGVTDEAKLLKSIVCFADNFASAPVGRRWLELSQCAEEFLSRVEQLSPPGGRSISELESADAASSIYSPDIERGRGRGQVTADKLALMPFAKPANSCEDKQRGSNRSAQ